MFYMLPYFIGGFCAINLLSIAFERLIFMKILSNPVHGKLLSALFGYLSTAIISMSVIKMDPRAPAYFLLPALLVGGLAYERGLMLKRLIDEQEFVANVSRLQSALMIFGAIGFLIIGLYMIDAIGSQGMARSHDPSLDQFLGWLFVVLSPLAGFIALIRMIKGGEVLRINSSGIRCSQWSCETIPWSEIDNINFSAHRRADYIRKTMNINLSNPRRFGQLIMGATERVESRGDVNVSFFGVDCNDRDVIAAIRRFQAN